MTFSLEVIMRVIRNSFFAAILIIAYIAFAIELVLYPVYCTLKWISDRFRSYIDKFNFGDGPHSIKEWLEVLFFWLSFGAMVIAIWFPYWLWS